MNKPGRKPQPPEAENKPFAGLERAADQLIDALPNEMMRTILRETARSQFIPLWMLINGLLQRAYDNGEHTAPIIDPVWLNTNPISLGDFGTVLCKSCPTTFTPRWPGQEYCCELCGIAAYRDRIAADRAAYYRELATYPVGQEPPGVSRSTIHQNESDGRTGAAEAVGSEADKLGELVGRADPVAEIDREAQASVPKGMA